MLTTEREMLETDEKILTAFCSIGCNLLFNRYAMENVVLGNTKPGEKIPYGQYLHALGLQKCERFLLRTAIRGEVIDEEERIVLKPHEYFCRLFYVEQMERVFARAPKFRADDEDLLRYKYGLGEYLERLYSLFLEVLSIEPREGYTDLFTMSYERESRFSDLAACAHFLFALKIKKLRRGSRIDRYINSIPFPNEYVRRLIEGRRGHYILTNADTESLGYKLALLSCFTFYTAENQAAFAEKIKAWECRQNKRDPTPFVPIFRA